ncbi:MAG: glycosyltransferase family 39 protein [Armatimonadota bacterium]|nr:glycosyltransferase family 39 protein [Armatimonadota bacterium]MDR7410152.1 glycosyltransferase family 39 protein [Armatimonadota bacterium]
MKRDNGTTRPVGEAVPLAGVLLLAVVFRWELLGLLSLWFDEGYSLAVASLPPREILQFLRSNDAHPAGYYLLLSWWLRVVGRDLTLLRLPSLVAGLGSVIVTWLLARRWCAARAGLLAAGLVALNPFQVYASNELRMYAPLGRAVLLAVLFLDLALDEGRVVWWLGYGLCVAAAVYLSYFAALAVLPQVGWVLTRREPKSQRGLLLALAVAAVLYLPWLPYLPGLLARNPQQWVLRPPVQGHGVLPYALSVLTSHAYGGYLPNTVTYHRGSLLVAPYLPSPVALRRRLGAGCGRAGPQPGRAGGVRVARRSGPSRGRVGCSGQGGGLPPEFGVPAAAGRGGGRGGASRNG